MRGLPKRYSTIYIDGVKMYDPSTPDNSFYAEGLFTDNIERIEIFPRNLQIFQGLRCGALSRQRSLLSFQAEMDLNF